MFFFKTNSGVIQLSNTVLSNLCVNVRETRSVNPNSLQFRTKRCNTVTYQRSYTVRATRIWNVLPYLITNKSSTTHSFKKHLLNYYFLAMEINYNIDDPRSWKTICVKCNQARDLTKPLACCFLN